ncbi:hypothetical protein [Brevibacillus sp. DP1.3A]|uniref:hypothetical protein n=1 Tax=Brevibacillus sp. DP1.3A TaxID=2738867 RepID=UPI00156B22BA|nr:hypothetical protein [Brevibacillus sp. DP1.3A]UED73230.1 hypothetical protein HP399_021140 [Brevibacillus sp. DP1.3A]
MYEYQTDLGYQVPMSYFQLVSQRRGVELSTFDITTHNDLGNGFHRYVWEGLSINNDEYLVVRINAGNRKVISAGYGVSDYAPLYAMESLPLDVNLWHMTIFNQSNLQRRISFYLIAKD